MTTAQKQSDTISTCLACGLPGRNHHMLTSRPGEMPERWVRNSFDCPNFGTGLVDHPQHRPADAEPKA